MMKKIDFDGLIKQNILDATNHDVFGYTLSEKTYDNYYSNDEFSSFLSEMESSYPEIFQSYNTGSGSELKEKAGRYGNTPPKMASAASSSRFCYLALRNGAQGLGYNGAVKFECECRINGISGNAPQLDAYIPEANIYVEAKCHEIFDSHKVILKEKYWNLIYGTQNDFGFEPVAKPDGETFEIPLSLFEIEKSSSMFDIKQLLCHLLGIVSQQNGSDFATLIYLFFKPKAKASDKQKAIDEIFENLQDEICKIFASAPIQHFITTHKINLKAIAEYSEIMEPLTVNNILKLSDI